MMEKVFTLSTWKVFPFLILPAFFPSSFIGSILTLIWAGFFVYAYYLLGNMLYEKLPARHDLSVKIFNFNLIFAFCYVAIVSATVGGYTINQDNYVDYGWSLYIVLPLHFYTMFAMFYCLYFIAKAIATIEHNRRVKFDTYAGNFFLLWFFPIGIWWMQPKIRRIFSGGTDEIGNNSANV